MDCWSGAKILCDFWDTKINTDNIILTTRYRSEDIPGFVADPEEIKKYVHELVNNAHMAATDNKIRDTILINQKFDYLYAENGRLKAVVVDNNGEPQVTDVTPDKPYSQSLITDGQGDTLVVSKKGQVMGVKEYKFAGDDRHLLNEYHRQLDSLGDWQINFTPAKNQTYAFDYLGSGNHGIFDTDEYYPKSGNYDFRYKSVECGKSDKVKVEFGAYPQADSVIFKDKYGVTLKLSKGNILNFTGTSQADTNYIYAYRGDKKIGKLMLNVYKRKPIKVCLVMVNGAHHKESFKEIKESLDKVFLPAVVEFEILSDEIEISGLTSFSHGGSGILTVYNDDQKKVLSAYEKEKKMTDGVYYLFFIDNVTDKKDGNGTPVSGYMPRGYNAGFIYDGGSPHTIAHELGHGIAGLEHVFENSNNSGKTANLMDYSFAKNAEELWHFQWDQIQDPSRVWMKWNKAEEEGENVEGDWLKDFLSCLDEVCVYMFVEKFRRAYAYEELFITDDFSERANIRLLHPKNCDLFIRIQTKAIQTTLHEYSYSDFCQTLNYKTDQILKEYLNATKDDYNTSIKQYLTILDIYIRQKNTKQLFNLLTVLPEQEYAKITIQQRINILRLFSECFLTQAYYSCVDDERIVVNLIKYTPENDAKQLLDFMFSTKDSDNYFEVFKSGIDGDNFLLYLIALCEKWKYVHNSEIQSVQHNFPKYANNYFIWSNAALYEIDYSTSINDHRISITTTYNYPEIEGDDVMRRSYTEQSLKSYNYDDVIILKLRTIPDFFFSKVSNESKWLQGSDIIIPAFLFQSIIDKTNKDTWINGIDLGVTVVSFVWGIGELKTFHTLSNGKKFMILLGLTMDGYSIVSKNDQINHWLENRFFPFLVRKHPELGQNLKQIWESIINVYDIKNIISIKSFDKSFKGKFDTFKIGWASFKQEYFINFNSADKEISQKIDNILDVVEIKLDIANDD